MDGDVPDDIWRFYDVPPLAPEDAAEFLRELGRDDLFARLPPALCADPQPSSWLDDWHPLRQAIPRMPPIIPYRQLQGRLDHDASLRAQGRCRVYTFWAVVDGRWRVWHDDWGRVKLFSPHALHQAAELVSGEILDVDLPGGHGEIVCFIARNRGY